MQSLFTFFQDLGYMAHGMCLLWQPWLIALFMGSDLLIFAAYSLIPLAMLRVLRARPDIALGGLPRMFVAFILLCGLTHLVAVVTLWIPIYEVQGVFKLATALVSMATVAALFPLVPRIIALPSPAVLTEANDRLTREIAAHEDTLDQLRQSRRRLEDKVAERTQALERTNEELNIVLREAGNRAGNLKTLMEALAHRTARETSGPETFTRLFKSRLTAVVEASDALTRGDGSLPDCMRDLAETQLSAYIAAYPGHIRLSGETRKLSPVAARQIGLALNELVTNAVKHGALRDAEGTIQLHWSSYRGWPEEDQRFQINWTETLSPAAQRALARRDMLQDGRVGFGTHVLSLSVPRRLNGRADIDFLPEGLSYALDLPLDCVTGDPCGQGDPAGAAPSGSPGAAPPSAAAACAEPSFGDPLTDPLTDPLLGPLPALPDRRDATEDPAEVERERRSA
ncbi:sensor histidine kinase [Marinovum sp.]|uniref:sensor histidine kinase n=1 Tax=Marinovum sp. TaxID=2024839 RepID=UPI002B2684AE|nr:HWE histidine kinase domain-containing protein [Marinovum sp.]